ncbi:MAG: hypothetical protein [Caudoviricetes sp.]|nr:MAG: hypothetical protein [Caudoviricetes sp.]
MTVTLIIAAGIVAFAVFIAGCFVGHRTGRQEGSDSAARWNAQYAGIAHIDESAADIVLPTTQETWYYVGGGKFAVHADEKPVGPPTRLNSEIIKEGWDL